jgi:hypothetical protein
MPCFGPLVRVVYPTTCDPYANRIVSSDFVEYNGDNLSCTGIQNCDTLTVALQKIDNKICSDDFVAQIIQTIETNPVLKAYFCQLVSSCSPTTTTTSTTATPTTTTTTSSTSSTTTSSTSSTTTTTTSSSTSTTTTTTTAGPTTTTTTTTSCTAGLTEITFANGILNTETSELIIFDTGTVEDACNALAIYLGGGGVWVWGSFPAFVSSFEVGATTIYPGWCTAVLDGTYINPDASNVVFTVSGGLISSIVDCSSTTTTTTTTIACATPTLNSATSDGFGNVTLDYDLNGSTLCTDVSADYSDYPSFSPFAFGETIPDGCNQTSYILTLNTSSTQYIRVSMICDGNTLNSNVISVIPGTTTTTTTIP